MNKAIFSKLAQFLSIAIILAILAGFVAVFAVTPTFSAGAEEVDALLEAKYDFTIDSGSDASGVCNFGTDYAEIKLVSNGTYTSYSTLQYYYLEADAVVIDFGTVEANDWVKISSDNYDTTTGVATLTTYAMIDAELNITLNTIYNKYLYFKVVNEAEGVEYIKNAYFNLVHDRTMNSSDYDIVEIIATYNGGANAYNLASLTPNWVASPITISVKTRTNNPEHRVYYQLPGLNSEKINFKYNTTTGYFEAIILGEDSQQVSYSGIVSLYGNNVSNTDEREYKAKELKVYIDKEAPVFSVAARKANGDEYAANSWSNTDITYRITPITEVLSGAKYQYSTDGGATWTGLDVSGAFYVYTATETMTLQFRAVSNAGVTYNAGDEDNVNSYVAQIDKVKPVLNVSAVDAGGIKILSVGSTAGSSSERVGYASDTLTFTLTNSATQDDANNPISFEYYIEGIDTSFKAVPTDNNVPKLVETATLEKSIVDRVYHFRVVSGTGASDEVVFTASVLRNGYPVVMQLGEIAPNSAGWLNSSIPVSFTMPIRIGGAGEYEVRAYITGETTTEKTLTVKETVNDTDNTVTYSSSIDKHFETNGGTISFYVVDKAKNRVEVDKDEVALRTPAIKLDMTTPSVDVVTTITGGGSIFELAENEWAASRVTINMSIAEDVEIISGITCWTMLDANTRKDILAPTAGKFVYTVDASGVYYFEFVSGSGLSITKAVTINIDDSDIVLEGLEANVEGSEESLIDKGMSTDEDFFLIGSVANDVIISFLNSHGANGDVLAHFEYYYLEFFGAEPTANESAYTLGTGTTFRVEMPEDGTRGTKKYAFIIKSKAKYLDDGGNLVVKKTLPVTITINYDVRVYGIEVSPSGIPSDGSWASDWIEFTLNLEQQSGVVSDITIEKYQYKLGNGEWIDIDSAVVNNEAIFIFKGLKYYYNDDEKFDDQNSVSGDDTINAINAKKYSSYNGEIRFRAINTAGFPSNEPSAIYVKMDTSTPSALYAVNQTAGEIVEADASGTSYIVYSKGSVELKPTVAEGAFFGQKAPIRYYYTTSNATETQPADGVQWTLVNETKNLIPENTTSAYYWVYADNGLIPSASIVPIKLFVKKETKAPVTSYVSGGTVTSTSGLYEFNWTSFARVRLKVTSETDVYFWYMYEGKADSNWTLIGNKAQKVQNGTLTYDIFFLGEPNASYPDAIVGSLKETVKFKVTNLSGWECEVDSKVLIKIDVNYPEMTEDNIILSTLSQGNISIEDAKNKFYAEDISVKFVQFVSNPSGVEYLYKVEGEEDYEQMSVSGFSTRYINNFEGGTIKVTFMARQLASNNSRTIDITFNIDKVVPTFVLVGQAIRNGSNAEPLNSHEWTNADVVSVSKESTSRPFSKVTYTYYYGEDRENASNLNGTLEFDKPTLVTVIAVNQAGVRVERSFQVNIDKTAPVINSGNIVNSDDPNKPNEYYIDQKITYVEDNLKSAMYNNYPLPNGHIIATNTVDNSNGGLVHIVVTDLAGNKTELTFYMKVFDLTVNNIEINDEDIALLDKFRADYISAVESNSLDENRSNYFKTQIARLDDRLAMLRKQIADYQAYLKEIDRRPTFSLISDYPIMNKYLNYFTTEDVLVLYPQWQQDMIKLGYEEEFAKLEREHAKLESEMIGVRAVEKAVTTLPAMNVVTKEDYQTVFNVYTQFYSLNGDQKTVFNPNLKNKLDELKRLVELYRMQDEGVGVEIVGDNIVMSGSSMQIVTTEISKTSETFNNAQLSLLENYDESAARSIICIKQVAVEGEGAQYKLGICNVTMDIPEEFYGYINYAVYKLYDDGTIVQIENAKLNPDAKSVTFQVVDELGKYILTTQANTTVRPQSEKIYGTIANIEIDAKLLTYITYTVCALFVLMIIIMVIIGLRRRKFFAQYNKDHKKSLLRRGITAIPKGNPPPASNPARPEERVRHEQQVRFRK